MSLIVWRTFIAVSLPFAIAWSVAWTLAEGFRDAFYFAWLEARNEVDSARAMWRGERKEKL